MKEKALKYWWLLPVFMICFAGGVAWLLVDSTKEKQEKSVTKLSLECSDQLAEDYKCWKERVQSQTVINSPEVAFEELKQSYETSGMVKSQCHQLSHIIGRSASKKYGGLAEAYKHGDNFCWSGYYHGVLEDVIAQTGSENIVSQISSICAPASQEKYSFYHFNCVHGLGHGVMIIEKNDLNKSLKICDNLNDQWEVSSCHGGVFMENIMSFINPDHHTDYIKADDPAYPCTIVEEKYQSQCWLMQTSHALNVYGRDFSKVFKLCSNQPKPNDATCYQSLGRDASGSTISDPEKTKSICMLGETDLAVEGCVIGASNDFVSYFHDDQKAYQLCASFTNQKTVSLCNTNVKNYYSAF